MVNKWKADFGLELKNMVAMEKNQGKFLSSTAYIIN